MLFITEVLITLHFGVACCRTLSVTAFKMFIFILCVLGVCWRKRKLEELFFLYLLSIIIFSSAIANQYLVVVCAAIAVYPNIFFVLYMLLGGIYLVGDVNGLHIRLVTNLMQHTVGNQYAWYQLLIWVLFAGLLLKEAKGWRCARTKVHSMNGVIQSYLKLLRLVV